MMPRGLITLFLLSTHAAQAHPFLKAASMEAQGLEEYEEAARNIFTPQTRSLQSEDEEASRHILADHFDGTPGFYHGVASGMYEACTVRALHCSSI